MEEATIVSDLKAIGVDIRFTGKVQRRVDFDAHVSGSLDGIIENGVPEAPLKRHVAEFKTHSKKSFEAVVKDGVVKSKPMHHVQMQIYMHGTGIDRALYIAICKDDDRIYTERVRYDKEIAERFIDHGQRLALAERMPEPMPGASASWFECKWCPAYAMCWKEEPTKYANCRTCAHITPKANSTFRCERHGADNIPVAFQHKGCDDHIIHPDLVPWPMIASDDGESVMWRIGDRVIQNGAGGYKSREILANPEACGDPMVDVAKALFDDAEVVG